MVSSVGQSPYSRMARAVGARVDFRAVGKKRPRKGSAGLVSVRGSRVSKMGSTGKPVSITLSSGSFCSIRDFLVSLSVTNQKSVGAFRQEAFILMESVTIVITGLRDPPDLT